MNPFLMFGAAGRREFISTVFVCLGVAFAGDALTRFGFGNADVRQWVAVGGWVLILGAMLAAIAVHSRRLQDLEMSGLLAVVALWPFVNVGLFVFLAVVPSGKGPLFWWESVRYWR